MNYLVKVQKAIAVTEKAFAPQDEYAQGWVECAEDLTYGISLGSEHAVKQQIRNWVGQEDDLDGWDDNWKGYVSRMKQIHSLVEGE